MKLYRATNKIDVLFSADEESSLKDEAIRFFLEIIKNCNETNSLEELFEVTEITSEKEIPEDWKKMPIWGNDSEITPAEFLNLPPISLG